MAQCPFANILDPDLYKSGDHHETLMQIRHDGGPVVRLDNPIDGVPYWAVLDRDIADYVCKTPELFSSEERTAVPREMADEDVAMQRLMVVNMDPPKHIKYRRIARNAFTPRAVDSYEANFRKYARQIIDAVAPRGECEFITEVAAELPLIAILELCGVPTEDRRQVFDWTNAMFFTDDDSMSEGDNAEAANAAAAEIYAYAARLAEEHQRKPLTNIVGALLDGQVEDEKLTPEEFQLFFLMLIAAGNESTRSVTAHGMRLLIEHPDQLQLLVDHPEMIPGAIEEMLRFNPAFVQMRRTVMEDTELGGQSLKKGDKLILNWHAINRDEGVFDDPMAFDVTRPQRMPDLHNQHRAFGIGQHYCLGAHLARLEMQVMFEEIIPRLRHPRFTEPPVFVRDSFVNGIKTMNIAFEPEAA